MAKDEKRKEPSFQNMPVRTEIGRQLRNAFVRELPLIDRDYSDLEKRVLERLKQDVDVQ